MSKRGHSRKHLKVTPSAAGDQIRAAALAYERDGQHEHAAGMRQGADLADKIGTGGLQDKLDFALKQIDEAIRVLATVHTMRQDDTAPTIKFDVEGTRPRRHTPLLDPPPPREIPLVSPGANKPGPRALTPDHDPSGPQPMPSMTPCERAILSVLKAKGQPTTRAQLLILSGYRDSGGFVKAIAILRGAGYIISPSSGLFIITPLGSDIIGHVEPLPTGPDSVRYWTTELGPCPGAILQVLAKHYPHGIDRESLARAAGEIANGQPYSAQSGGFVKAIGILRKLKLVEKRHLCATEALMTAGE